MEFHHIKNAQDSFFSLVWSLYEHSFPQDERRNLAQQKNLFQKKEYSLLALLENTQFIGFFSIWDLGSFVFIDHFAIKEELRGKGTGTKILENFIFEQKQKGKELVLETERPFANSSAKKRIAFYERVGFILCSENYIQPAFDIHKKTVPLYLMRYGKAISKKEFETIKEKLYRVVYSTSSV